MNIQYKPLVPCKDTTIVDVWVKALPRAQRASIQAVYALLAPLFSSAPYLFELAKKHTDFICNSLETDPKEVLDKILETLGQLKNAQTDEIEISRALREAKGQVALLVAVAEVGGVWTSKQAANALSDFADVCVEAALDFLVAEAQSKGRFVGEIGSVTAANCGLCVLALGKHGGRELNYSSDIDVVTFFDPTLGILADPANASKTYSRIVQKLAALMQDRTEHGYVFRTDLRLRPDPGATPVALSVDGALSYYESRGQNWERAAWIKARHIAGDGEVAQNFLKELAPFIWRKHLDFATISDIQAMKRQINIVQNVGQERVAGHNVKLGRGGIREIEFFAQTQQLIAGGRELNLRVLPTVDALQALADNNWISHKIADDLEKSYWLLRAVENRVQMINDAQTHIVPEPEPALAAIALLMGFETLEEFKQVYRANLEIVTCNYTNLFTDKNALSTQTGSLVFTGTDDDPATLETLNSFGFSDPAKASEIVRNWQYGRYAATRAAASRAHLTELVPLLLQTISKAGNADTALHRFDIFLSRLPAGVQLFAMLRTHDQLCQLLIAFMASAPRMAEAVIRRAHVLDGLVDPARTGEVSDPVILAEKVECFLGEARSFEEVIERARIIGQEQGFLISAGMISGAISHGLAAIQYATLAQTLLDRLFERVRQVFEQRHGIVPGARVALLAFGRLGSEQMNAASDLDVILLYDIPEDIEHSNGEKPLDISLYYTRLTQRLISAISSPTAEGVLYEVDMRLRPSGNAGPLATSLSAFITYQKDKAWTWEHQALTRARVIYADDDFADQVRKEIDTVFACPHEKQLIISDVLEMRARLLRDRPPRHSMDLKLVEGGLMDIEFIAQSAVLFNPDLLALCRGDTVAILHALFKADMLSQGEDLARIYELMSAVLQISSTCLVHPETKDNWTEAFQVLLARLTNYPDFERLQRDIEQMQERVKTAAIKWYKSNN